MKNPLLKPSLLTALLLFAVVGAATAQNLRPEQTFYVKPYLGFSNYLGENDATPFDFGDWGVDDKFIPYAAALEVGYQASRNFGIGVAYQVGDYPSILRGDAGVDGTQRSSLGDYTRRHTAQLLLRYTFAANTARIAPFVEAGAQGTVGYTDFDGEDATGFGPLVGAGLDILLNDRTSLFVEGISNLNFGDIAADGAGEDGDVEAERIASFDVLSSIGVGLKLNFKRAFTPVEVLAIDGPADLEAGADGTFSATTNDEIATQPIEYRWDWGDGTTATGLLATHSYESPGTYTVTFTADNDGATDTESMTVTVVPPPVPAEVVTIDAAPSPATAGEEVAFTSNVQGDTPIEYSWDFGDGATGSGASPTHTYETAGTYTATLEVTNETGTDARTLELEVEPSVPAICLEITEMNSAFFSSNSSTLTDEARSALQENADILAECANLSARIEGFAAPGERNAQGLSEDRARAVEQFYLDNGVAASRLVGMGMGQVTGVTSKKGGASQFRRVDTVPLSEGGQAMGGGMAGAADLQATIEALQGGVTTLSPSLALNNISTWITTLEEAGDPSLADVADTLEELRDELRNEEIDGSAVGQILSTLSEQTSQAAQAAGVGVSDQLSQLSDLLSQAAQQLTE